MTITFRPLTEADLPALTEWRNRPHVVEWYGGTGPSLDDIQRKYRPRIADGAPVSPYFAYLDGRPIGYIQSYVAMSVGNGWWEDETDPGVRGTDQFLANEDELGQGLGTRMVSAFVERLFSDPEVSAIQVDPAPDNAPAICCYEKAGFRRVDEIVTPDGPAVLMVLRRP